jgi:hypothetical protein
MKTRRFLLTEVKANVSLLKLGHSDFFRHSLIRHSLFSSPTDTLPQHSKLPGSAGRPDLPEMCQAR